MALKLDQSASHRLVGVLLTGSTSMRHRARPSPRGQVVNLDHHRIRVLGADPRHRGSYRFRWKVYVRTEDPNGTDPGSRTRFFTLLGVEARLLTTDRHRSAFTRQVMRYSNPEEIAVPAARPCVQQAVKITSTPRAGFDLRIGQKWFINARASPGVALVNRMAILLRPEDLFYSDR